MKNHLFLFLIPFLKFLHGIIRILLVLTKFTAFLVTLLHVIFLLISFYGLFNLQFLIIILDLLFRRHFILLPRTSSLLLLLWLLLNVNHRLLTVLQCFYFLWSLLFPHIFLSLGSQNHSSVILLRLLKLNILNFASF